jgi:hypothetical protein
VNGAGVGTAVNTAADSRTNTQKAQVRWQKPAAGRHKCNVYASFSASLNCVGYGMCIWDEEGRFVLAQTLWS